jgi:hypothetical protein
LRPWFDCTPLFAGGDKIAANEVFMETEDPAKKPSATLELSDANLTLWRGCTFKGAPQQWRTGDRMIIKDKCTGAEEDVLVVGAGAQRTVKGLVMQIEMATGRSGYSFAELDAANQKRLLTIYKMFDGKN